MRYTVILEKEPDGSYVAIVPVLPGCVSQGESREEALKNIQDRCRRSRNVEDLKRLL